MKALDRKLLRDLRLMWSQVLTIALVVGGGVAGFITSFSAYDALSWSRFVLRRCALCRCVRDSQTGTTFDRSQTRGDPWCSARRNIIDTGSADHYPNVADPIIGRMIRLDAKVPQRLNKVHLRSGRMIASHQVGTSGLIETLVSEGFAIGRQLKSGDRIHALINGQRKKLLIVGIALSPEYIFAGWSTTMHLLRWQNGLGNWPV